MSKYHQVIVVIFAIIIVAMTGMTTIDFWTGNTHEMNFCAFIVLFETLALMLYLQQTGKK